MARRPSCDCGVCPKCLHRERARAWYWRNRDHACRIARESRDRNIEHYRDYDRKRGQRGTDPAKQRARHVVEQALRNGTLIKGPCEHGSGGCRGRIEAHHENYSEPLSVRWLCQGHHGQAHRSSAPGDRFKTVPTGAA